MDASELPLRKAGVWPFIVAAAFFVLITGWLYGQIEEQTGGFTYPIDDTYIHLAIGRNIAEHGVWGNTQFAFASASSSLLWTTLMAGAHLVAPSAELAPLVLNVLVGLGLIYFAFRWLRHSIESPIGLTLTLLLIVMAVPMPLMAISGMEHLLHALLACAFMAALLRPIASFSAVSLAALGLLMVGARYEGLFLVAAAAVALALQRRWLAALGSTLAGLAPVLVFGFFSQKYGAMMLPNSVAIKGAKLESLEDVLLLLQKPLLRIVNLDQGSWLVVFTLVAVFLVLSKPARFSESERVGIGVVAGVTYLHAALADFGWLYRYEAYLFALVLLFVVPPFVRALLDIASVPGVVTKLAVVPLFLLLLYTPLRIKQTYRVAPIASKNIHDQQVQMARFVKRYHDGEAVAANDIGALSYYTNARIIDLFGLGSNEIAKLKKQGKYDTAAIDGITKQAGVKLAILYPEWFTGKQSLPEPWTRMGYLRIENNFVCAFPDTTFYAVDAGAMEEIEDHLIRFPEFAPDDIVIATIVMQEPLNPLE